MVDKSIRQLIIDELDYEPSVSSAHIGVAVDNGVVKLSGHVGSYGEKLAAEKAVRRVKGVKALVEGVDVRYTSDGLPSDEDIASRCLQVLLWNAQIPKDTVQVKVERGWVTLTGTLDWQYEKSIVESAIRRLAGVVGVLNQIDLHAKVATSDVKRNIIDALKRSAEIEADSIRVTVNNDRVTLEGNVRDWSERYAIEHAAWSAVGVKSVEDNLAIV